MLFVFILLNLLFVYYFFIVGTKRFALLPIAFILFVLFNFSDEQAFLDKDKIKNFLIEYVYVFAWLIILIGLFGIAFYLNITDKYLIALRVCALNIFLFIASYFWDYNDGKKVFHYGIYFSIFVFFYYINKIIGISFSESFFVYNFGFLGIVLAILFATYSFLKFIVLSYKKLPDLDYVFLFYLFLFIFDFIFVLGRSNFYYSLFLAQVWLLLFYIFVYFIFKKYDYYKTKQSNKIDDLYQNIINDKSLIQTINTNIPPYIDGLNTYFKALPSYIKFGLSFLNIVFIILQIALFAKSIGTQSSLFYEVFYWLSVLIFFINFLLIKAINFYYYLQRIFVFLILNFAIYLSILNVFGANIYYIVIVGIIWNFINIFVIFSIKNLPLKKIFYKEDYYFWIFANFMSALTNIYFVFKLQLDIKLKFSLAVLYFGVYMFLSLYNIKYINKL